MKYDQLMQEREEEFELVRIAASSLNFPTNSNSGLVGNSLFKCTNNVATSQFHCLLPEGSCWGYDPSADYFHLSVNERALISSLRILLNIRKFKTLYIQTPLMFISINKSLIIIGGVLKSNTSKVYELLPSMISLVKDFYSEFKRVQLQNLSAIDALSIETALISFSPNNMTLLDVGLTPDTLRKITSALLSSASLETLSLLDPGLDKESLEEFNQQLLGSANHTLKRVQTWQQIHDDVFTQSFSKDVREGRKSVVNISLR